MTSVLLSIRPEFATAILAGRKRVEFRKRKFARPVERVFLYSSGKEGRVVGSFAIRVIKVLSPRKAWERYRRVAGISRRSFFAYFAGAVQAVCIEVRRVRKLQRPVQRRRIGPRFLAPQSYAYLTSSQVKRLEKASRVRPGPTSGR